MRNTVHAGPLTALVRECWVLKSNRRVSAEIPNWTNQPLVHSIVVESVNVEEAHRRQGHLKRFLDEVCADPRFDMVIVEGVQNPILAEALLRWGWDCNVEVMDFYHYRNKEDRT